MICITKYLGTCLLKPAAGRDGDSPLPVGELQDHTRIRNGRGRRSLLPAAPGFRLAEAFSH